VRRFYPVGPQKVNFDVAAGQKVSRVRALRADKDLAFRQERRSVSFEIPSVLDYEVAALT